MISCARTLSQLKHIQIIITSKIQSIFSALFLFIQNCRNASLPQQYSVGLATGVRTTGPWTCICKTKNSTVTSRSSPLTAQSLVEINRYHYPCILHYLMLLQTATVSQGLVEGSDNNVLHDGDVLCIIAGHTCTWSRSSKYKIFQFN